MNTDRKTKKEGFFFTCSSVAKFVFCEAAAQSDSSAVPEYRVTSGCRGLTSAPSALSALSGVFFVLPPCRSVSAVHFAVPNSELLVSWNLQ
jgi:hypothetical protein